MLTKNEQIKQTLAKTLAKRKSQVCRVFRVKVDESKLNKAQKEHLKMLFVEAKRYYNHILNWSEDKDNDVFKFDEKIDTVLVLNKYKEVEEKKLQYLTSSLKRSIHEQICSSIKSISTLKKRGYQKSGGKLKYKSDYNSLNYKQFGHTHQIKGDNRIKLQGIKKPLIVRGLNQFIHEDCIEIANIHLLNTPSGYYIAITTFIDKDKISTEKPHLDPIGIDFGCQDSFTFSNGKKVNVRIEESERIKRLQRKFARQKKGSNNFNKTKRIIGKEYQRLTNKKKDAANKLVAKLKKHKLIVIQDEQLQNWAKSNHGKAVQYSTLGRVKAKLKELPQIVVLDKMIPTTKLCTNCGKTHEMKLWDRQFNCPHCGYHHEDRDVHAAENMLWIAQVLFKNHIPLGQREFKPVEFLSELEKHCFDNQETMK